MIKTLKIATILTGVSAFAMPAIAQNSDTIIPGSETGIQQNEAETRNMIAEESEVDLSEGQNPTAGETSETIVPGSETLTEQNEAEVRNNVAEDGTGQSSISAGEGSSVLVPGSGATFSPRNAPQGQDSALQDEADTSVTQ